ncbi:MAG: thioredoxin family protein, partial [Clostridiales bacterium]|nr:thioredoxin family protein [Clostridiales bacterium]
MKKLKLYSRGCDMHNALHSLVLMMMRESEFRQLEFEDIIDLNRIADSGAHILPTLRVGDKNIVEGAVPSYEKLKNSVRTAL